MNAAFGEGGIVCISLETATERRKDIEAMFGRLGIQAQFFIAKKHPKGGCYGCFDSHIQVIQKAYDAGIKRLLVFEDDALPTPGYTPENVATAIGFMDTNQDWDLFYLGYVPVSLSVQGIPYLLAPFVAPGIVRYKPITTHALCYSRRGMEKILHSGYEDVIGKMQIDEWLVRFTNLNTYCCVPVLFEQQSIATSNNPNRNTTEAVVRFIASYIEKYYLPYKLSIVKQVIPPVIFWIILATTAIVLLLFYTSRRRPVATKTI